MKKTELRYAFIKYLEDHYSYAKPYNMAGNVLYSYNNSIGMDFWDIFISDQNMNHARDLIQIKFEEVGRKNPKGHASVHYGCWVKFKEFLDDIYGGAEKAKVAFSE